MKANAIKYSKLFVASLLAGCCVALTAIAVSARSSSDGAYGYYTDGISYYNYNNISTGKNNYNEKYASGMTYVYSEPAKVIPDGYAGVCPVLYDCNGNIAKQGTWFYSGKNDTGIGSSVMLTVTDETKAYYAKGSTRAWNGEKYNQYSTFATVCLSDYTSN